VRPVAWLSVEADDADRRRFWHAVIATLSDATGDPRIRALTVSPRAPMDIDLGLPALVDALDVRDEPVVLVLDDSTRWPTSCARTSSGSCATRRPRCVWCSSRAPTRPSGSGGCDSKAG
jgi:hypothetical protein